MPESYYALNSTVTVAVGCNELSPKPLCRRIDRSKGASHESLQEVIDVTV